MYHLNHLSREVAARIFFNTQPGAWTPRKLGPSMDSTVLLRCELSLCITFKQTESISLSTI